MEKRLKRYLAGLEQQQMSPDFTDAKRQAVLADLLIQINFFQHERLIHLLVTLTFAILAFVVLIALTISGNVWYAGILFLNACLLIPYIRHYFVLENGVQKLYKYYDKLSSFHA